MAILINSSAHSMSINLTPIDEMEEFERLRKLENRMRKPTSGKSSLNQNPNAFPNSSNPVGKD